MNKVLVSVLIPTWNRADLLPRTVQSVLNQTEQDFEIIIIDDASDDMTSDVVRGLQKKDSRISYERLSENSGGAATPKNKGIKKATGEFIAVLDADDIWHPEKLERQLKLFTKTPSLSAVGCAYNNIRDGGNEVQHIPEVDHNKAILIKDYMGPGSCIMYKKSLFETVGLFDPRFKNYQDWDMRIRIALADKFFGFINEPLLDYIVDEKSISNRSRSYTNRYLRMMYKKHWREIYKNKPVFIKHILYLSVRHLLTFLKLSNVWMYLRNSVFKNKTF